MISRIHIDQCRQVAQVLLNERKHILPFQPPGAVCQPRQGQAFDMLLVQGVSQAAETMIDVSQRRAPGLRAVVEGSFLREQVEDSGAESTPLPDLARLR